MPFESKNDNFKHLKNPLLDIFPGWCHFISKLFILPFNKQTIQVNSFVC